MYRKHWIGLFVALICLSMAAAAHPNGRMLPEETLSDVRGGQPPGATAYYSCAVPSIVGQGCTGYYYQSTCYVVMQGNLYFYNIYYHCLLNQYDMLCYRTPMTGPYTSGCYAQVRNGTCVFANVAFSTWGDCSVYITDSSILCGNLLQYGCQKSYDSSAPGLVNNYGVDCRNVTQGNF